MNTSEVPSGFEYVHSGKVLDLYQTPEGLLLLVASDRISVYGYVLTTLIPDKGAVLTAMMTWWFTQLRAIVPNHLIAVDDVRIPQHRRGRAMLCQPLDMVPVEAVARGYLTGSALKDYDATGAICGIALPPGLIDGDRLPEAIFTPASKAARGEHGENVSFDAVAAQIGADTAAEIRRHTLAMYEKAATIAAGRGIILADTTFEFGFDRNGRLVLGGDVLTPDSSRFWPALQWRPEQAQPSFAKQYVRDWLTSDEAHWNRRGTPPPLPEHVVQTTRSRYVEAYEWLTGLRFADWLHY